MLFGLIVIWEFLNCWEMVTNIESLDLLPSLKQSHRDLGLVERMRQVSFFLEFELQESVAKSIDWNLLLSFFVEHPAHVDQILSIMRLLSLQLFQDLKLFEFLSNVVPN